MEKAIIENKKRLKFFSDGKEWLIVVIGLELNLVIQKRRNSPKYLRIRHKLFLNSANNEIILPTIKKF